MDPNCGDLNQRVCNPKWYHKVGTRYDWGGSICSMESKLGTLNGCLEAGFRFCFGHMRTGGIIIATASEMVPSSSRLFEII